MKKLPSISFRVFIYFAVFSSVANSQWSEINGTDSLIFSNLTTKGQSLFASGFKGAYRSTDTGLSWHLINSGLARSDSANPNYPFIHCFGLKGDSLLAGTDNGIFVSTDNGDSWSPTHSTPNYALIQSILPCGSRLLVSGHASVYLDPGTNELDDLFISTDNGDTWSASSNGIPANQGVNVLTKFGASLFAGTNYGIYRSIDQGASWNMCLNVWGVLSFASNDTVLIANAESDRVLCLSSDTGRSWTSSKIDTSIYAINSINLTGSTLIAATEWTGIYVSTNWGKTWQPSNDGFGLFGPSSPWILSVGVSSGYAFAAGEFGIWRRPLSQVTSVTRVSSSRIPTEYSLEQNFPNPFNPTTEILFRIPSENYTTLEVFDLLGRRISILVSQVLKPGNYQATWNASSLPSGVFLYRLSSGLYTSTRKMIVIK